MTDIVGLFDQDSLYDDIYVYADLGGLPPRARAYAGVPHGTIAYPVPGAAAVTVQLPRASGWHFRPRGSAYNPEVVV